MKTGDETLKPCPFCGGKPYLLYDKFYGDFEIGCKHQKCKVIVHTFGFPEKKKAIAAWNNREVYGSKPKEKS